MKTAKLQGFASYTIQEDGVIIGANGKIVKPNAKGIVTLVCSESVGNFNEGQKYQYEPAALVAAVGDNWTESTPAEGEAFDPNAGTNGEVKKELTPEQTAAKEAREAKKAERKALEKTLADVTTEMVEALTIEDTMAAKNKMVAAKAALAAWDEANKHVATPKAPVELTDEQKALQAKHAEAVANVDDAKSLLEHNRAELAIIAEECRKAGLKVNKTSTAAGDSVPSRGKSVDYDTVQAIRKDYAVGRYGNAGEAETVATIAERYGVSGSGVMHYVNYQQQKLRRGDTAYTPLVNDYYNAESGFENGAPFFEEGIKETAERYKKPADRVNKSAVAPVATA